MSYAKELIPSFSKGSSPSPPKDSVTGRLLRRFGRSSASSPSSLPPSFAQEDIDKMLQRSQLQAEDTYYTSHSNPYDESLLQLKPQYEQFEKNYATWKGDNAILASGIKEYENLKSTLAAPMQLPPQPSKPSISPPQLSKPSSYPPQPPKGHYERIGKGYCYVAPSREQIHRYEVAYAAYQSQLSAYKAAWAEYDGQMSEYNRQLAAYNTAKSREVAKRSSAYSSFASKYGAPTGLPTKDLSLPRSTRYSQVDWEDLIGKYGVAAKSWQDAEASYKASQDTITRGKMDWDKRLQEAKDRQSSPSAYKSSPLVSRPTMSAGGHPLSFSASFMSRLSRNPAALRSLTQTGALTSVQSKLAQQDTAKARIAAYRGLSEDEILVLSSIYEGLTDPDLLATAAGLTRSQTTGVLKSLKQKGRINFGGSATDVA